MQDIRKRGQRIDVEFVGGFERHKKQHADDPAGIHTMAFVSSLAQVLESIDRIIGFQEVRGEGVLRAGR